MNRQPGPLIIRADAGPGIGTGHVMRCLALAQAWQERGGVPVFVSARLPRALARRLEQAEVRVERCEVEPGTAADARTTRDIARRREASWIVLDGYDFDYEYQCRLRSRAHRILVIDDGEAPRRIQADLVLNQNLHADPTDYPCISPREQLLSPRFALLRREFQRWRDWGRSVPDRGTRVLVTLGGGCPKDILLTVAAVVRRIPIPDLSLTVVIPYTDESAELARDEDGAAVEVLRHVDDMGALMSRCDIAISAAGSTVWELMFMRLPTVLLTLADNQEPIARAVARAGAAINTGQWNSNNAELLADETRRLICDPERRRVMMAAQKKLVDGRGAERVAARLEAAT